MTLRTRRTLTSLALTVVIGVSFEAIGTEIKIELAPNASVRDVLDARSNQPVRLKLRGGEEIRGTVVKVAGSVVHLSRLDGADAFFDAVVALDAVAAVLVRVREK